MYRTIPLVVQQNDTGTDAIPEGDDKPVTMCYRGNLKLSTPRRAKSRGNTAWTWQGAEPKTQMLLVAVPAVGSSKGKGAHHSAI